MACQCSGALSPTWRAVAAAVLAAGCVLAGCGSSGSEATRTVPAPRPPVEEEAAELDIIAPRNGATLAASERSGSRLRARARVRGKAEPRTRIAVSPADCTSGACRVVVRSDRRGRFRATVALAASASRPGASIVAAYADPGEIASDRVTVLVEAPARETAVAGDRSPVATTPGGDALADDAADAPALPHDGSRGASRPPRTLVMIGDSLAEGSEPFLGPQLAGWRIATDARRSRVLADGMRVLAEHALPSEPVVLAFSLFTNDPPTAVRALSEAVRTSVRRARSSGCAVWATIARPPQDGVGYGAANAEIRRLASAYGGRLIVVPWAETVRGRPDLLARDGVHASAEGYRVRATMYADAARRCGR